MSENVEKCPLCGSTLLQEFDKTVFREQKITYQICKICGFVFQSPRMTGRELDEFYVREYRQMYQGSEGPTRKDLWNQTGRAEVLLAFVKHLVPTVKRHLDIGCSAGILLKTFNELYLNQSIGVEPGKSYRDHVISQGIQVYASLEDLSNANTESFDLITMAHVLEHVLDPVAYLQALREKFLVPGGYLLIEVPNLYSHDSFEIAHMSCFSYHTLSQALQKAGYLIVSGRRRGKPRSSLLPLYITMLARSETGSRRKKVNPERVVKIKRKYGMLYRKIIQRIFPNKAWISIE